MCLRSNCSPTGRASWKIFQVNILIFGEVCNLHTHLRQFMLRVGAACCEGFGVLLHIALTYPVLTEYSPDLVPRHMRLSGAPLMLGLMVRMRSISCGIIAMIVSTSQVLLSGLISSAAVVWSVAIGAGPIVRSCVSLLSQPSFQMLISLPFLGMLCSGLGLSPPLCNINPILF